MKRKSCFPQGVFYAGLLVTMLLGGCASHQPAPVIERQVGGQHAVAEAVPGQPDPPGYYTVKKGDTLFSIGLDHGQSYRDLGAWNNLDDPNRIHVGQRLRVAPPDAASTAPVATARPVAMGTAAEAAAPLANPADLFKHEPKGGKQPYSPEALARLQQPDQSLPAETKIAPVVAPMAAAAAGAGKIAEKPVEKVGEKPLPAPVTDEVDWLWPSAGKVIANFAEGSSKGIDIAGKPGEAVLAAAPGKVILVSSALRGYGNFVIVKHNAAYLSVYAHNSRILVKEEQNVARGEKIAEVGSSDTDRPKLHFEIRRQGKPVDPLKFLPAR